MKYFLVVLLSALLLSNTAIAQDSAKDRWQYFGLHGAGLLAGSSGQALSLTTTNGIRYGNWHAGITTGIDWYGVRSIPLLASLYRSFGTTKNQPFAYGSAGISFPWEKPYNSYYNSSARYSNSFMGEAGLGYFISLKNKTALSLSAGYSYKRVVTKGDVYAYPGILIDHYDAGFTNTLNYRRIAIRLGIKI